MCCFLRQLGAIMIVFQLWQKIVPGSYQCPGVGVCPLVQQQLGDAVVSAVRGHVQGGQVVQRDVVDGRLVLQQVLHTLHVVALGRHVEWRQAVLSTRAGERRREVLAVGMDGLTDGLWMVKSMFPFEVRHLVPCMHLIIISQE